MKSSAIFTSQIKINFKIKELKNEFIWLGPSLRPAPGQMNVLERDDMKFYVPRTLFPFINKLSPNKILYGSFRTARIATRGCDAHLASLGLGATTRCNYVMRS